ncbi:LPS export ABC transporter periplasmic protein LptC [Marinoscillum sp. MHG1-6]|uniref:LPS export ABC transporter periplasmic protein LptC n=1 Tax=Marinoscillum sp. MHG1-6 TaxID=2959627 RepID=UPI0021587C4B|nr:LPS export ABC transporter periplasmic protein LptC [Marinoscillum sp. MHG1-6]
MKEILINFRLNNSKTIIERFYGRFFVFTLWAAAFFACEQRTELIDQPVYDGPTITMDSVYTKMSDSAQIVMILTAPRQLDFENDDREWPKGMYLEYLDHDGNLESTFKADYVYYTAEDDIYKGTGNVVVKNMETGDELTTEELFWSPKEEKFYTDRFVTIVSDDEVHTGEGLVADEDFETYKITKPSGTINLEDDETP